MANSKITDDPRIDPRIKALFGAFEAGMAGGDVANRDVLLKEASTQEAIAQREMITAFLGMSDTEEVAPSAGLVVTEHTVVSEPDGNKINIRFIRPEPGRHGTTGEPIPCVYYI